MCPRARAVPSPTHGPRPRARCSRLERANTRARGQLLLAPTGCACSRRACCPVPRVQPCTPLTPSACAALICAVRQKTRPEARQGTPDHACHRRHDRGQRAAPCLTGSPERRRGRRFFFYGCYSPQKINQQWFHVLGFWSKQRRTPRVQVLAGRTRPRGDDAPRIYHSAN